MPTTVLATALPYSLADDAPFHLTVFVTHKLVGRRRCLSDFPAAADWPTTLAGCSLTLSTSLGDDHSAARRRPSPDAAVVGGRAAARDPCRRASRRPRSRPRRGAPTPRAG